MSDTMASDWTLPPEPVTWHLHAPLSHGNATYSEVTIRCPTAGDVMKASAVRGASGMDVTLRLIAEINAEGIPYDALRGLPHWVVDQMSNYIDSFLGAPPPIPLRRARPD